MKQKGLGIDFIIRGYGTFSVNSLKEKIYGPREYVQSPH